MADQWSTSAGRGLTVKQRKEADKYRGSIQLPRFTLFMVIMAIGLFLLFGSAPEALVYDRSAIAQGEVWRVITGHWVHSDLEHAVWDIAAFLILACLFVPAMQQRLFTGLLFGMLMLSAYIFLFMPELELYCGLSGILNTILVIGLHGLWHRYRHPMIPLVAVASLMKIIVESNAGKAIFTNTAWQSVPEVHLAGFVVGVILILFNKNVQSCSINLNIVK